MVDVSLSQYDLFKIDYAICENQER